MLWNSEAFSLIFPKTKETLRVAGTGFPLVSEASGALPGRLVGLCDHQAAALEWGGPALVLGSGKAPGGSGEAGTRNEEGLKFGSLAILPVLGGDRPRTTSTKIPVHSPGAPAWRGGRTTAPDHCDVAPLPAGPS